MVVDISKSDSENVYFNNSEYHAIEPIIVITRSIPKKLPSRVNASVESGYFICMDSENSEIEIDGETSKVQVLGMTKVLGETVVEDDGSFYLELIADRPVRKPGFSRQGSFGRVVGSGYRTRRPRVAGENRRVSDEITHRTARNPDLESRGGDAIQSPGQIIRDSQVHRVIARGRGAHAA